MRFWTICALATIWIARSLAFPILLNAGEKVVQPQERETDQPPEHDGDLARERGKRRTQVERQMMGAFQRNPVLKYRMYRTTGHQPEHEGRMNISKTEINNALRQADHQRDLFPEIHEPDVTTAESIKLKARSKPDEREKEREWEDYDAQFGRAAAEIEAAFQTTPGLYDRAGQIMNRLLNEPPPKHPTDTCDLQRINRALREAGYTGHLYPEWRPGSKPGRFDPPNCS